MTINGLASPSNESCCTLLSIGMGGTPKGTSWSIEGQVMYQGKTAPINGSGMA
jgi:hypothetical protein